jgi:hypothetical protein
MAEPSDQHPSPDAAAPAEAHPRSCVHCGAGLAADQDWCLECGTAQPGRLGRRPGRRAVLTVLALTGVLAGGATAASYAALEHDATSEAVATAPATQPPAVAQAPPATAPADPATGTEVEETPTIEAPESEPPSVPEPSDAPEDDTFDDSFDDSFDDGGSGTGSTGSGSTGSGSSGSSGSSASGSGSGGSGSSGSGGGAGDEDTGADDEPDRVALELPEDAASLYDPYARIADAETVKRRDPSRAIDGKERTAWELPAPDGVVNAGLVISLDEPTRLGTLELEADIPGFTVEVYATRASKIPPDVLDKRWEHLTDRRDAGVTETLRLDGRYRHVLLWFTQQPADTKIAISEITLFED